MSAVLYFRNEKRRQTLPSGSLVILQLAYGSEVPWE